VRLPRKVVGIPLRLFLFSALLLAVVSVAGSLVYLMLRPVSVEVARAPDPDPLPAGPRRLLVPIDIDTLEIPDEMDRLTRFHWVRFRPPRDRWGATDVERFWIDPGVIGAEYLSRFNRLLIEEMLKDIP
jgi:hypothetical protein